MEKSKTNRGFQLIKHDYYVPTEDGETSGRLICQSSAIEDYENSFDKPGSSYLWIDEHHRLNREEVSEFVKYLNHWLETGMLYDPQKAS